MSQFKPDLSVIITIRVSKDLKNRALLLAKKHNLLLSEALRYTQEAGLALAEADGMGKVFELRQQLAVPKKNKPR